MSLILENWKDIDIPFYLERKEMYKPKLFKTNLKIKRLRLSPVSKTINNKPNDCKSSKLSEVISAEMFNCILNRKYRCRVKCKFTEGEIKYNNPSEYKTSKKTDYVLEITKDNLPLRVAVQVKRIHQWKNPDKVINWHIGQQIRLVSKANSCIKESNKNVFDDYNWDYQILHIITTIDDVYPTVKTFIKNNKLATPIIIITKIDKDSEWIVH